MIIQNKTTKELHIERHNFFNVVRLTITSQITNEKREVKIDNVYNSSNSYVITTVEDLSSFEDGEYVYRLYDTLDNIVEIGLLKLESVEDLQNEDKDETETIVYNEE